MGPAPIRGRKNQDRKRRRARRRGRAPRERHERVHTMRLVTVAPADAAAESTPLLGFMLGSATYSFQGAVAALGGWPRVGAPEASFQDMLSLIDGGESVWE